MYTIHIKGRKKAVYMLRHNLLGYGLPEITYEDGDENSYIMHCEMGTQYDAIPNQHSFDDAHEEWDGKVVDLSEISLEEIMSGQHDYDYSDYELDILSGMFDVDIEVFNDPDDKWWEDVDFDDFDDPEDRLWDDEDFEDYDDHDSFDIEDTKIKPQYPFYAYSKGKEIKHKILENYDSGIFSF